MTNLFMVLLMALTFASHTTGYIAHYSPGLMLQVANTRVDRGELTQAQVDNATCFAASMGSDIGDTIYVENEFHDAECLVVDIVAKEDRQNMRNRGIVIETDYYNATQFCPKLQKKSIRPSDCPQVTVTR